MGNPVMAQQMLDHPDALRMLQQQVQSDPELKQQVDQIKQYSGMMPGFVVQQVRQKMPNLNEQQAKQLIDLAMQS